MPTAGVCDQRLGGIHPDLLDGDQDGQNLSRLTITLTSSLDFLPPQIGVCDQHAAASFRLLPTTIVCDSYLGALPRPLPTAGLLTTERSEVVPFFRAVRAEKRVAKPPTPGAQPPLQGREATLEMLEGSPPFVSFCYAKCPKRQRIWTKLCRKQLLVKPH